MSQTSALRNLDAGIAAAFRAAGLADGATYTAPAGAPIACTVLVDRDVELLGSDGADVAMRRTVVTLFLGEIAAPAAGAVVAADGSSYTLEAKLDGDQSRERWVVRHG